MCIHYNKSPLIRDKKKIQYLIRLDDACQYMDRTKWQRMEDILDKYGVKPLVGIIPDNADLQTKIEPEDAGFWGKAHSWEEKGWCIALHGHNHVCISDEGMDGLNPFWSRSEFAGLPLEQQKEKIRKGYAVLKDQGFEPKYFFAPSHTFDENTLEALRQETGIRIISDTVGRYPYSRGDFVFIPQISGHCVRMPVSGVYTFCFHPNTMNDDSFNAVEDFLDRYGNLFVGFDDLGLSCIKRRTSLDKILSWVFFAMRKLKGLK